MVEFSAILQASCESFDGLKSALVVVFTFTKEIHTGHKRAPSLPPPISLMICGFFLHPQL